MQQTKIQLCLKFTQVKMATKTIKEMAQELKLNMDNVEFGLKTKPKETEESIKKAYEFIHKKR